MQWRKMFYLQAEVDGSKRQLLLAVQANKNAFIFILFYQSLRKCVNKRRF